MKRTRFGLAAQPAAGADGAPSLAALGAAPRSTPADVSSAERHYVVRT